MRSGVTLDGQAEILPAGTKLRLLRDRILVRPLDWNPSSVIQVIRHGRALRGVVESTGPGRYYRRYRPHPTDRNKRQYTERGTFIPMQVKPGDVVELGGLNAFDGLGYNFPQVVIGTETFIIAQEQDVAFVDDGATVPEAGWCCEKGRQAGVEVCADCHELFGSIPN
jgi:hypothetical protein